MNSRTGLAARILIASMAIIAIGAVLWSVLSGKSSTIPSSPPLSGWMESFTPLERRGPAVKLGLLKQDGQTVTTDFLTGKLVLVNFWATWCGPCVREMPSLMRLHEKMGGDRFSVIALSQDFRGWEKVTPFLERYDLAKLPVFVDPKTAAGRKLKISKLPTSVLLDGQGREIGRLSGHAEWDSEEAQALIRYYLSQERNAS